MIYFYENVNWWDYIYLCMCVWIYGHTCIYAYTFCSKFPQKIDGDICINLCCFHGPPSHLLPTLPHLFSGAPLPQLSCPALPHTGWPLWSGDLEKGALQRGLHWMYCSLFASLLLRSVSCPERSDKRSGVYRMSVFKSHFMRFPLFFFSN